MSRGRHWVAVWRLQMPHAHPTTPNSSPITLYTRYIKKTQLFQYSKSLLHITAVQGYVVDFKSASVHYFFPLSLLQDGSCNGLQHYAALGRDVIGATSVNLMPCELPQDVYSGVAQQVSHSEAAGGVSASYCPPVPSVRFEQYLIHPKSQMSLF